MKGRNLFTKILAVVGTVLVWFPILATVVISVAGSVRGRPFRIDYLLPAELFPVGLIGGGLLLWAALRARLKRRLIGWGFGGIIGLLAGGQALAVVTGLASGETEPVGLAWALVVASLAAYSLALIELGATGILLVRNLFQPNKWGGGPAVQVIRPVTPVKPPVRDLRKETGRKYS